MITTEEVLNRIRKKVDHPATIRELQKALSIADEDQHRFRRRIRALVASGALVRVRGNRYGLPNKMNLVVGRVHANPRGFGFVVPDEKDSDIPDIYISGVNLNQAMHGDHVVARVERERGGDRLEGRIVKILERQAQKLVGRYDIDESGLNFVVPFDKRIIMDVHIPATERAHAKVGEMVVVELTDWPTTTRNPVGRITEVLGELNTSGVDVEIILHKYGIPDLHSKEALREAQRFGQSISAADRRGRTDFRDVTTVTIDGNDARDFDDAITIKREANGNYLLGVHIADVAHYVQPGSALDREAYARGTSVYFSERAVHMFPESLATGLCSLNPKVDRLVQSCLMEIDSQGQVVNYEIHDGIINSSARMTYHDVSCLLTDTESAERDRHHDLIPLFQLMHELFHILQRRRRLRGSIDFDVREAELVLDEAGLIEAITASERNVAQRIIEEFMLLANETVAHHLNSNQIDTLYRVHESPDPLKIGQFKEFISTLGHTLVSRGGTRPKHFQQLVDRVKGTTEEKPIVFLMLRTMQKARYDVLSLGHFGLAAEHYTHFTSPIRRYADLVVHRVLRRSRHQEVNKSIREKNYEELSEIAKQVSQRDTRAEEAERELLQWKKVRFMADKVGDEYDGYVIGVTAFGLFIELIEHFVEGFVHISSMADDYYRFVDKEHLLQGEKTRKSYRLGASVRVQVIRVDLERRQVDLGLVDILKTSVPHKRETRRRRRAPTSKNSKQKRVPRNRVAGKRRPR